MFWQMPSAFQPSFQPEAALGTFEQVECYKARAKAHRARFPWSNALLPVWNATLVHLSANVPGKVAYYASIPALLQGRLTRTSPEMFLERTLVFAPDEVRTAWCVEVLGKTLPQISFVENTDPEGWFDIYMNGPNSCMAGRDLVKLYAHPKNHLALAYHRDAEGDIVNRVIVNKKRKTYLRVYGTNDISYFIASLNKLGYTQSSDTLKGETIYIGRTECCSCGSSMLTAPYLDGGWNGIVPSFDCKEGVIGPKGRELTYSEEPECGCCDEGDEDYDE